MSYNKETPTVRSGSWALNDTGHAFHWYDETVRYSIRYCDVNLPLELGYTARIFRIDHIDTIRYSHDQPDPIRVATIPGIHGNEGGVIEPSFELFLDGFPFSVTSITCANIPAAMLNQPGLYRPPTDNDAFILVQCNKREENKRVGRLWIESENGTMRYIDELNRNNHGASLFPRFPPQKRGVVGVIDDINVIYCCPINECRSLDDVIAYYGDSVPALLLSHIAQYPELRTIFTIHEDFDRGRWLGLSQKFPKLARIIPDGVYFYVTSRFPKKTDLFYKKIMELRDSLATEYRRQGIPIFGGIDDDTKIDLGNRPENGMVFQPVWSYGNLIKPADRSFESLLPACTALGMPITPGGLPIKIDHTVTLEVPMLCSPLLKRRIINIFLDRFLIPFEQYKQENNV